MRHQIVGKYEWKCTVMIILVLCLLMLSGCVRNADDVKLANERQILKYAKKHYGACEVISREEGENEIRYTLQDERGGFEYHVRTYAHHWWLDTSFGYSEMKDSDFDSEYLMYLRELVADDLNQLCSEYDGVIDDGDYQCLLGIDIADAANAEAALCRLGKIIEQADAREHFYSKQLSVSCAGDVIGYYRLFKGEYTSYDDNRGLMFQSYAQRYAREAGLKGKVSYLRAEHMLLGDICSQYGLSEDDISIVLGNEDRVDYTLFWYSVGGTEYFVSDVMLRGTGTEFFSSFPRGSD